MCVAESQSVHDACYAVRQSYHTEKTMNLKEFAALKVGDQIENPMTRSTGEITECNDKGVRVRWIIPGAIRGNADGPTYPYATLSTGWMHWTKVAKGSDE